MKRERVDMRLPDDLLERVDAEADRLGQTRTKFVERALERALAGSDDLAALNKLDQEIGPIRKAAKELRDLPPVRRASELTPVARCAQCNLPAPKHKQGCPEYARPVGS